MIVTVNNDSDVRGVRDGLVRLGLWVERFDGSAGTQFVVGPHSAAVDPDDIRAIAGVSAVATKKSPHPKLDAMPRTVQAGGVRIGADAAPVVMAGPCSVESEDHVRRLAEGLAARGVRFLRGGAYKPRTSPYSFQGHGETALRWLRKAADEHGMGLITECMGEEERDLVAAHADLIQIGSRNMHNYSLLKSVASTGRPVFLKRGLAATLQEWLLAAEYCLAHGSPAVVLCERGVRSFDTSTRFLLDLAAVAQLSHVHRLPVVVDPSHATGRRDLVIPLCRAALAAGAHGVMVETHADPAAALSDGPQAVRPEVLFGLLEEMGLPGPHQRRSAS